VASYVSFLAKGRITGDQLPHYLVDDHDSFETAREALAKRCDFGVSLVVLDTLSGLAVRNAGAGRNAIRESLSKSGITVTEGETRKLMALLRSESLIRSSVGRGGSEITLKGETFRRWAHGA
jgi:hypothetical protein